MKKLLTLFLILVLVIPAAVAEDIDLSALTFDQLVALRARCQMEMMTRDEWQEVTVPAGLWKIGEDIPAGHWVISGDFTVKGLVDTGISYGDKLTKDGKVDWMHSTVFQGHTFTKANPSVDIVLEEGFYLEVNYGPVIFTPYTGKPDLGFK